MDAGWYENNGRWQEPKAYRADRMRFPRGLRGVTDHAHARGLKTLVWFEPERVMPTNELFRDHPEWLLRNPTPGLVSRLLYLGDPAARAWLTDLIDRRVTEEGIDVYRQDFCIVEPSAIWRGNDAPDRQGITENHHVTGYLAFWDELHRRHPDLIIDTCAGGGSRNDLETLRRALPFWRSDYPFDPVGNQAQTYGLAPWWPFYGTATGIDQMRAYELRSNLTSPLAILTWNLSDRSLPYDALRRAVQDWREYAPNYFGDFYPLTPWSLDADHWLAWQFDRPEVGRGVVQAFRRPASLERALRVKLRGLDRAVAYRFTELDERGTHPTYTLSGREAMDEGVELTSAESPGAVNVVYEKMPDARANR
jgi:alpha-galactosidase